MDPASASVAFVGFAASLITISSSAAESLRTLKNLWHEIRAAPEESRNLISTVETVLRLTRFITQEGNGLPHSNISKELGELWQIQAACLLGEEGDLRTPVNFGAKLRAKGDAA